MFALGKLGWTPREYYTSSPYEFYAACEGYSDKMEQDSLSIRMLAHITMGLNGSKQKIENVWPLRKKEGNNKRMEQPTKEWWDMMMKRQAQIDKDIKDKK